MNTLIYLQDGNNKYKTTCYLRGLILRSQLVVLLQNKVFNGPLRNYWDSVTMETFRHDYPRYSSIEVSIF